MLSRQFLTDDERSALADALGPTTMVRANTDLVREDDRTDRLFILVDGWACRYSTTRDGGRQLSALLVPGDTCNVDSFMFERLDYGVRTLTIAKVAELDRDRAAALATAHAGIARVFTWLAMVENTVLSRWTVSLGRRSATERLAHLLCELSVRLAAEQDNASSYEFPLTQEHIGDALGLTTVHVNRTVRVLREAGLVDIASRTVTLPDMGRLRQIGGFDQNYLHVEPQDAALA